METTMVNTTMHTFSTGNKEFHTDFNFNDLCKQASEIEKDCQDFVVDNVAQSNFRVTKDLGVRYTKNGTLKEYGLTDYSLSQLSSRIGVPSKYIIHCKEAREDVLAQANMNKWLARYNKPFFVRQYQDDIRGVLTPTYKPYDSKEVMDLIEGSGIDLDKYKVKGSVLTPERLHMRLVSPNKINVDGEDLFPAILVNNSDVGMSSLNITFGIYKMVCTNGLVIGKRNWTIVHQVHKGVNKDIVMEQIAKGLKRIPHLASEAEEFIRQAMQVPVDTLTDMGLEELSDYLKLRTGLSKKEMDKVINLANTRYSATKWGIVNGITEVAQDFSIERRLELERQAGVIMLDNKQFIA